MIQYNFFYMQCLGPSTIIYNVCPKSECRNFTHYYRGGNDPFFTLLSIVFVLIFNILHVFIHLCIVGLPNLYSHVCHCFNSFKAVTCQNLTLEGPSCDVHSNVCLFLCFKGMVVYRKVIRSLQLTANSLIVEYHINKLLAFYSKQVVKLNLLLPGEEYLAHEICLVQLLVQVLCYPGLRQMLVQCHIRLSQCQ